MPVSVSITHQLSATTPDNPAYEIRPSHWNSAHAATASLQVLATEISGLFSNKNGVSFGLDGTNITGSIAAGGAPGSISAGTTNFGLGQVVFSNSNGVSFGLNGATVTATVQTNYLTTAMLSNAVTLSNINVSAGTTSNNLSAITFSNSNKVSFGLSGSVVTASWAMTVDGSNAGLGGIQEVSFENSGGVSWSVAGAGAGIAAVRATVKTDYLTAQSNLAFSASGGSSTFQTLSFNNANGLTFSNVGGAVQASYSVPTQTNQSVGLYASSNTTLTSSGTADARSLSFRGIGGISVGVSASEVLISGPQTAAQTNQTVAWYASSNTTLTSSGTADARSLSVRGLGIASVGFSNNELLISVPTGAPSPVNFSAGTTSGNLGSVVFSNSNGVSFGLNGATITASANAGGGGTGSLFAQGNTTQNSSTTQDYSSMQFGGRGAASVGFSNGTVQISVPATSSLVGASGISISTNGSTITIARNMESMWANLPYFINSQTQTVQQSTSIVWPMDIECELSIGFARMLRSVGLTSTSFASTGNTSYSYNYAETHNLVLYTQGIGANSLSLRSVTSTSVGLTMSVKMSRNTTNNISVTHGFSYPVSNGTSSTSFSYAATNSTDQFSSTHLTAFTAGKLWDTQFGVSLDANQYWGAYGVSTAETTQQTNLSGLRFSRHTIMGISQINSAFGVIDGAANASLMPMPGCGSFSTAGGGSTASIPFANVSSSASHVVPFIQFGRIA